MKKGLVKELIPRADQSSDSGDSYSREREGHVQIRCSGVQDTSMHGRGWGRKPGQGLVMESLADHANEPRHCPVAKAGRERVTEDFGERKCHRVAFF